MPVRHILVVDDSKSARLMLRKMLQGFGMTVDTAESAEEALSYLRDRQPDAIFMDHTMPGMDGLTAARHIKDNPATASIPVAMYTSRDDPAYVQEARSAGAIDVLTKPAMPEMISVLLERMHQALDAAQAPLIAPAAEDNETVKTVETTVSVEWVEKIVADKAESVIYDAIESQILPLLNDVIARARQEMDAGQAKTCSQVAERICQEQLAAWQPSHRESASVQLTEDVIESSLSPWLDQRLAAFQNQEQARFEGLAQNTAEQVCKSQLHELSERLVHQLSARFTEAVRKAAAAARDAAVKAAREAAIEAAREAAIEAARVASLSISEGTPAVDSAESMTETAERAARQLWADAQRDLKRRTYWAAGWAAVIGVGVGAALVVYGLR